MKVTGQSSLIAAQTLGVQRTRAEAKAVSAAFFAELKKTSPTVAQNPIAPSRSARTSPVEQVDLTAPLREAPLRGTGSGAPLPPGSLLNIVV